MMLYCVGMASSTTNLFSSSKLTHGLDDTSYLLTLPYADLVWSLCPFISRLIFARPGRKGFLSRPGSGTQNSLRRIKKRSVKGFSRSSVSSTHFNNFFSHITNIKFVV